MTMQKLFDIEPEKPEPRPPPEPSEAIAARRLDLPIEEEECQNCYWMVGEAAEYWSAEMQDDATANILLDLVIGFRAAGHPECDWLIDLSYYERPPEPPRDLIGKPLELPSGYLPDDFDEDNCDTCGYWWMLARHWYTAGVPSIAVRGCGNIRFNLLTEHAECWDEEEEADTETEVEAVEEREEPIQQSMFEDEDENP